MTRPRIMMRIVKGGMEPADTYSTERLRERAYRVGDIVAADITKPRNPKFWRLAHALGRLCSENLDDFTGMDAHRVLKRLQLESGTACDEIAYRIPGHGMVVQRIPQSLSFASMDEGDFRDVFRALCRHVAAHYWPGLDEDKAAEMAELMVGE